MQIHLASQSPRRRDLLAMIGLPFVTHQVSVDERAIERVLLAEQPKGPAAFSALVQALAQAKAQAIANRLLPQAPKDLVLGADTIVALEDQVFGKPAHAQEAEHMLCQLSGKTHHVYTGVCLYTPDGPLTWCDRAEVSFYPLTPTQRAWIHAYAQSEEPLDKAGAYAIQGRGALLIEKICGDFYTIMGLPIAQVARKISLYTENNL